MKQPWFRLHAEFAYDPKIQSMDETLQRRFIMLLCLKCNNELLHLSEDELAYALRIDIETLQKSKKAFLDKGFIHENWDIKNWDKRQYKSDNSTVRSRRCRERQKNENKNVETRNEARNKRDVPATLQNVAATHQIQIQKQNKENIYKRKIPLPTKPVRKKTSGPIPKDFKISDEMKSWASQKNHNCNLEFETEKFIDWAIGKGELKSDWTAAWRNWVRKASDGVHFGGRPSPPPFDKHDVNRGPYA